MVMANTASAGEKEKAIKCVVWDLDNTVWDGVVLEDRRVALRSGVREVIEELDNRGILQSIASKNHPEDALRVLRELGLDQYFLHPQIGWNPKSHSIKTIAQRLNVGVDTFAFIDDQPFERDEVAHVHPNVHCIDAADVGTLLEMPRMIPRFITSESRIRRSMYQSDIKRQEVESEFKGPPEEFLAQLGMVFTIAPAQEEDLRRAEELTARTNQLNTTAYTYSYEELDSFRQSPDHLLLIAGLDDKYGTYGKIGLALIECDPAVWTIKLMLMSCRVMSRGVGTIMLSHCMFLARERGVRLRAEFKSNDRNRMMLVTYKFAGFRDAGICDGVAILENDLSHIQTFPPYVRVVLDNAAGAASRPAIALGS
jgi:FkbH-like protein